MPADLSFVADVAGWYGTAAILSAYALNAFGVLTSAGLTYKLLNLTGALGVAWICWRNAAWQAFWLEAIWAAVALVSIVAAARSRRGRPEGSAQ
jgi:hypothetical protein